MCMSHFNPYSSTVQSVHISSYVTPPVPLLYCPYLCIFWQRAEPVPAWQLMVHGSPAFLHLHWQFRHPDLHWHEMRDKQASGMASFVIHKGTSMLSCTFHPIHVGSGMLGLGMCPKFQISYLFLPSATCRDIQFDYSVQATVPGYLYP